MTREIVVGTRGSALALAQTELVCAELRRVRPGLALRVERITTTGDVRTDVPLSALERGMFVTEIEAALRDGRVDIAVHSAKDLPSTLADDMAIAAFLPRADARDVLIARDGAATLRGLPAGARVGTSSPRRMCQLRALRPDLDARDIRGNVDTRIRKLRAGEFDALLLAAAGLVRLQRDGEATEWLDADIFVPCVGQGALAIEARAVDAEVVQLLQQIDDRTTRIAVLCERAFLAELGAGCRAAAAAHARVGVDGSIRITAMIGSVDGRQVRTVRSGGSPESLGAAVARELLRAGGARFLARGDSALRGATVAVTRPRDQSTELVELLRANGASVISHPAISVQAVAESRALDAALADASSLRWMLFTSANAVHAVADRLARPLPSSVRLAAVGNATAMAMRQVLRAPDFMPSVATAQALAEQLPDVRGRVLFPRGDLAADALVAMLRDRGADVTSVVVYHTRRSPAVDDLAVRVAHGGVDAIVLASPSAVTFVTQALDAVGLGRGDRPHAVCIGGSTARAAERAAWPHVTRALTPSPGALLDALERALVDRRREAALPTS